MEKVHQLFKCMLRFTRGQERPQDVKSRDQNELRRSEKRLETVSSPETEITFQQPCWSSAPASLVGWAKPTTVHFVCILVITIWLIFNR